jgi:activator of HSP90 ATPase
MAKIEEADPRWIVADREDGKNVNSWHWEERDLTAQVHEALKAKFSGLVLAADTGKLALTIKEVSDISGDVTIAQRKGKIMCYFELKMTLKWKGTVGGASVEGKLVANEVEHDNFREEYEIQVSSTEHGAASEEAEAFLRSAGRKIVRGAIRDYFEDLFVLHKVGTNVKPGAKEGSPSRSKPAPVSQPKPQPSTPKSTTSINWKMTWRVPQDELFSVLMNEQRAAVYTRAPAKIDPRPSGSFEFLGGVISGYFVEVVAPQKITMQWRLSSWAQGVFSTVVMILTKEEPAVTVLEFAQAGIPDGEMEKVEQGWRVNFFDAIKMMFGFGMEFR